MPRLAMLVAVVLLVLIGIVMVFSASTVEAINNGESPTAYVVKQVIFVAVGTVLALLVYRSNYRSLMGGVWFWGFWGVCFVLLCLVPLIGTNILGAKRWIYVGSFSIQPTEFAKIMIVVAAAKVLMELRSEVRAFKDASIAAFVLVLVPMGLILGTQSDMGSTIIILAGVLAVMWLGEVPTKVMLGICAAVVVVGAVALFGGSGYRQERVKIWLDPFSDQYGTGYQMVRSFYAFSEGGLFGVGLGNSREKFLYLPEAETDFIFSIIGEEFGLVGTVVVVALFIAVLFCGLRVAKNAADDFGAMVAGGLTCMLVIHAFLNMACATGLFPTTGKPLPFISSGGSSVIASLLMVGLILSVSRVAGEEACAPQRSSAERRRANLNYIRVEDSPASGAARRTHGAEPGFDERPRTRRARGDAFGGVMAPRDGGSAQGSRRARVDERVDSRRNASRGSSRAETSSRVSSRDSRRSDRGRRDGGRSSR